MSTVSIFTAKTKKNRTHSKYIRTLSRRHPRLKKLITLIGPLPYEVPIWHSLNDAVLYAVIGQMLSVQAADAIICRLLKKHKSSRNVIIWAQRTAGRKGPITGVSQRKRKAMAEWARYAGTMKDISLRWKALSLPEYRREVESLWGFGRWSADMIAIFHLGRMDVWPATDTGIQRACGILFGKRDARRAERYVKDCETVAAVYMWEIFNRKLADSL